MNVKLWHDPMSRRSSRRPASFVGLLILLAVVGCRQLTQTPQKPSRNRTSSNGSSTSNRAPRTSGSFSSGSSSNDGNLLLGNPSGAATDKNNYLLEKPQYTLSYNRRNGGPNWVAWHTDASNLGSTDRGQFRPDDALPADWQIRPSDYKNSGYDRGHVCPSGDRTSSRADNDPTFCMSNMMPQTGELNRHVWADLENYMRDQVRAGNEVYQLAGPAGNAGTIANGAVVVPRLCWKVAVILPEGTGDLNRINANTRVIAVAMPNIADKKLETADWRTYLTTPRKIEDATRLDFFSDLPSQLKRALEQKVDSGA
ncbi:nuclease [Abditibacteriota bacterium]|nr:nuclease [Abditibacteriota bacterium]